MTTRRKAPKHRRSNPHFATAAEELREIVSLDNRHMAPDEEYIYAVGWDYYDSRQWAHFSRRRAAEDYAHMIHGRGAPHVRVFTAKTPIRSRGPNAWKLAPPARSRR